MEQSIAWQLTIFFALLLVAVIIIKKMFFPCAEETHKRKNETDFQKILNVFAPGEKIDVLTVILRLHSPEFEHSISMVTASNLIETMVACGKIKQEKIRIGYGKWLGEQSVYSLLD